MTEETYVIESSLKRWPGKIELPMPDDFTGRHWRVWRRAVNDVSEAGVKEINRLFAYAGAEFIEKHGEWGFGVSLADFKSWRNDPDKEMVRFVSWVGKNFQDYITEITNPKE